MEAGVPMEIVTLKTNDGLKLVAWYHQALHPHLPTIIYFHGNAGNIGQRSNAVQPFFKKGYGVLLVTYRGYSGNPGEPSEKGLYQDGRAAIQFLKHQHIPDQCIVLYGESIGTAVAIQMAIEYHLGAIILQSPFTSLIDIGQFHYPFFPIKWLIKDQFNSLNKAEQIQSPVLVLYGEMDDIIPPKFSIQLFEALPTFKQMQSIPDIGHNDIFNANFAINFIERYVERKKQIKNLLDKR